MTKRKLAIIVLISLVAILLIAYLLFQPSYIHIDMPCMEMTAGGEPIQECQLVLTGLKYRIPFQNGIDFWCFELNLPITQGFSPADTGYVIEDQTPLFWGSCPMFSEKDFQFKGCLFAWHEDRSFCVVYTDKRFFVGSATGEYTYALDQFHSVVPVDP